MQPSVRRRLCHVALAAVGIIGFLTPSIAATDDIVKARIANFRELGAAFKSVKDALAGPEVQTVLIVQSAKQIRNAARAQMDMFPAGSGPQPNIKTGAKPEIWSKPKEFRDAQEALVAEADNFYNIAKAGNADDIRAGATKLGSVCKGCHDGFRNKLD